MKHVTGIRNERDQNIQFCIDKNNRSCTWVMLLDSHIRKSINFITTK